MATIENLKEMKANEQTRQNAEPFDSRKHFEKPA
jgi:hypothetical protein